jgi:hypothetical protein
MEANQYQMQISEAADEVEAAVDRGDCGWAYSALLSLARLGGQSTDARRWGDMEGASPRVGQASEKFGRVCLRQKHVVRPDMTRPPVEEVRTPLPVLIPPMSVRRPSPAPFPVFPYTPPSREELLRIAREQYETPARKKPRRKPTRRAKPQKRDWSLQTMLTKEMKKVNQRLAKRYGRNWRKKIRR